MDKLSFPFLWLSEPYFPMHWFTWPSFSTVGRTDLVLVLRLRTPPLLWFCSIGAGIPGAQSQSWSPWREAEESYIMSSCSVCEGEKFFKSQCQVREVRGRVGVGADWRVKHLGRCTPLFQEEFDVNQWSLNAWVSLGHFVEGTRRILKPAPKCSLVLNPPMSPRHGLELKLLFWLHLRLSSLEVTAPTEVPVNLHVSLLPNFCHPD